MTHQVFNSLAPVFVIIGLGALLSKIRFLTEASLQGLTKVTYWVGIPSLLFYKIATAAYSGGTAGLTFSVVFIGILGAVLVGYATARLMGVPQATIGTFVQAAFRGNLTFIGLPIVVYLSAGPNGIASEEAAILAILVIAPTVPIHNILSVFLLLLSREEMNRPSWRALIRPVVTNPLLLASLAGGLVAMFNWSLPVWLHRTTEAVGGMSLPLALITIGGAVGTTPVRGNVGWAFSAALIKTACAPAIGFLTARFLGLGPTESKIALIYLACPTAVASYVVANQLGGDSALAASTVVLSTVLSVISLGLVAALL